MTCASCPRRGRTWWILPATIAVELKAVDAARALIEAFSAAVERLAEFPYACRLFLLRVH